MTSVEAPGAPKTKAAFGRLLADFRIEGATTPNGLLPAEEMLVAAVALGEVCEVSDLDWTKEGDLKQLKEDKQYHVRPEVLRCLALGCDAAAPVHENGIGLSHAYIPGDLHFDASEVHTRLGLHDCYFGGRVILRNARTRSVSLRGSRIAGLDADGVKIAGDMFLREGFKAEGEVRLLGVEIVGDLNCRGATFVNRAGRALSCDGAEVTGVVSLSDGFKAEGEVRLVGAKIGVLDCCDAKFRNAGARALNCNRARITGAVFFREGLKVDGIIDLAAVHLQNLIDNDIADSKDGASELVLDGFTYERLGGGTLTDTKSRAKWLQRQPPEHLGEEFRPQPFEQLAKVLRAMGHDKDAREIGFLKEQLFRPQRVRRAGFFAKPFVELQWWVYGLVAGYGYKPHRILWILFFVWLCGAVVYWQAAEQGLMAPADAQVWTQADLQTCRPPEGNWTQCPQAKELPAFQPLVYSADVLVPIIDIGQGRYWVPTEPLLHWIMVLEKVAGTLLVLLFGAIVSGVVKRK